MKYRVDSLFILKNGREINHSSGDIFFDEEVKAIADLKNFRSQLTIALESAVTGMVTVGAWHIVVSDISAASIKLYRLTETNQGLDKATFVEVLMQ